MQRTSAQIKSPDSSIKKYDAADGLDFAGPNAIKKDSLGNGSSAKTIAPSESGGICEWAHSTEDLTQLDEMKTRFYNNISHELKTPLSLIVAPLKSIKQGNYIVDKRNQRLRRAARRPHQTRELYC